MSFLSRTRLIPLLNLTAHHGVAVLLVVGLLTVMTVPTSLSSLAMSPQQLAWSQDSDGEAAGDEKSDDEKKPAVPTPTFDDPEGEASFASGRGLFDEGKWKEAEKLFKKCKAHVVKDDRDLLNDWLTACKGGSKLDSVEKVVAKESWLKAWGQLEKLNAAYGKTPLRLRLDELFADVEPRLFLVLANYEEPAPQSQTDAGAPPDTATHLQGPDNARRGDGSLRWQESVGLGTGKLLGFLPLAKFEGGTLGKHSHVRISIYSENKDHGKFTLLLDNGELTNRNPLDILKENVYFHHLTINHVGWKDFRIDLRKEFATLANPIPDEMQRLSILIIPPSKPKVIRIDEVKLERIPE